MTPKNSMMVLLHRLLRSMKPYGHLDGSYFINLMYGEFSNESPLQWRHNERDGVSYHQPHDCLLKRLFRRISKKPYKFRVTGLCEGNSPVISEFPAQRGSNAENVSMWWRHHAKQWHKKPRQTTLLQDIAVYCRQVCSETFGYHKKEPCHENQLEDAVVNRNYRGSRFISKH